MSRRVILITGASSGIGRSLAEAYAGPAARLLLVGRSSDRLRSVADACRAAGAEVASATVDVRDAAAMAQTVAAWDDSHAIDLAIACAGITSGLGPGRDVETRDALRAVLAVNLDGVLNTLHPLLGPMMARGAGHVAVVGSLAALRGLPSSPAYCAAKAAVHAYAEGLRPRLARHGVATSIIAPGFVETPLNRHIRSPRPMQISPDRAARIIRRGLDRRKAMIAFPLPLYLGLRVLALLPARWGDRLLDRSGIDVPETIERVEPRR